MNSDNLAAVLDGLPVAVFLLDGDRQTIFANKAAASLFGPASVGVDFVQTVRHPDCLAAIDRVFGGDDFAEAVVTLLHPVRTIYQIRAAGLGAASGKPGEARAVVSFENISHIREAEQMRSEFVANVSHELRSPLTALSGFIETLQTSARDDAQARARFLKIMAREAQRMTRLISDLLSLSKVEASEHVRPDTEVDPVEIVRQTIAVLGPLAESEKTVLTLDAGSDPDGLVLGDRDQLSQVFLNLIENAIKYGRAGSEVSLTIRKLNKAPGFSGAVFSIEIKDQGAGIPPQQISRLTERFYRIDDSRSREKGGTGLGLAIVKHILARHRGRMQIKSEIGVGSRFTVLLPEKPA